MLLTFLQHKHNLSTSSPHATAGRGNPNHPGCKAANHAVFYCPSKIKSGLFRFKAIMTGCYRQLSSWPLPGCGISTLFQPVAYSVERISDGLQSNPGVSIMLKSHTQEPTKTNTPTLIIRLKSFFTLFTANREIIADNLTFHQAKPLSEHITGSVIKFDRMGGVA